MSETLPGLIGSDPTPTVAIADVDHFKRINDQLSHAVGDQVLIRVTTTLQPAQGLASPSGFVARLGGEEFLVVVLSGASVSSLELIRSSVAAWAGPA